MIITVSGRGASGKTTISQYIQRIVANSIYISGDEIVENCILKDPNFIKKINKKYNQIFTIDDIIMAYFKKEDNPMAKDLHQEFINEVSNYLVNITSDKAKCYIVDWFLIEKTEIFKKSDLKILLESDLEKRINRAKQRNINVEKFICVDSAFDIDFKSQKYDSILDTTTDIKEQIVYLLQEFSIKKEMDLLPLVSLIIPYFDAEKFIHLSLDSVVAQSYKNLEIILIDDGSLDNSFEICKSYQEKDYRIKLYSQENLGVSQARNKGMDIAKGSYIEFLDSDDTLEKDTILNQLSTMLTTSSDIVDCGINVKLRNGTTFQVHNEESIKSIKGEELLKQFLLTKINFAVWGKLYKKEVLEDLKFEPVKKYEDCIFMWEVFKKCEKYTVDGRVMYNYTRRDGNSLTNLQFNRFHMNLIKFAEQILIEVQNSFPQLEKEANTYYIGCILHNLHYYKRYLESNNKQELFLDELNFLIRELNTSLQCNLDREIKEKYKSEAEGIIKFLQKKKLI